MERLRIEHADALEQRTVSGPRGAGRCLADYQVFASAGSGANRPAISSSRGARFTLLKMQCTALQAERFPTSSGTLSGSHELAVHLYLRLMLPLRDCDQKRIGNRVG